MEQPNLSEAALGERFLGRLGSFLAKARLWLATDTRMSIAEREYQIEDPFGRYEAPGLELSAAGHLIASIIPVAGVVIGAEGRIDVKGPLDEAPILYLSGPGYMGATINGIPSFSQELFRGFTQPGWYWLSNTPSREVRLVDHEAFRAIVVAVSDYEVAVQS